MAASRLLTARTLSTFRDRYEGAKGISVALDVSVATVERRIADGMPVGHDRQGNMYGTPIDLFLHDRRKADALVHLRVGASTTAAASLGLSSAIEATAFAMRMEATAEAAAFAALSAARWAADGGDLAGVLADRGGVTYRLLGRLRGDPQDTVIDGLDGIAAFTEKSVATVRRREKDTDVAMPVVRDERERACSTEGALRVWDMDNDGNEPGELVALHVSAEALAAMVPGADPAALAAYVEHAANEAAKATLVRALNAGRDLEVEVVDP